MKSKSFLKSAIAVFLAMTSANAIFAHNFEVDGIYYSYNGDGTSVRTTFKGSTYTEVDNEYTGNVVIPARVTYSGKSYAVTEIGYETFRNCTKLTSVTIPNSVTRINYSAFYGCYALKSASIPENVTYIGNEAFRNCTSLTSISLPGNIVEIGNYAFSGCTGLKSMTIPESVTSLGSGAFSGCKNVEYVSLPNSITTIEPELFGNCKKLSSIQLPNTITNIGNSAFASCSSLTSVIIPNSVENIDYRAFYYCSNLESIKLSDNLKNIGNDAFNYCSSLKNITIPNSVTTIGGFCFQSCSNLASITIGNSVKNIGNDAFYNDSNHLLSKVNISSIEAWLNITFANSRANPLYVAHHLYLNGNEVTNLEIPETVTAINDYAFYGCTGLKNVTIPTSVTSIGSMSLTKSGITTIDIPNSVKSIGSYAFNGCEELQSAIISNSVVSIPSYLFQDCTKLTKVSLPNSINDINESAFEGCTSLSNIEIPNSVTRIGNNTFYGCTSLSSFVIPNSVKELGVAVFGDCSNLASVSISNNLETLPNKMCIGCTSLKSVVIPDKIATIGVNCFYGCTSLEEVTIGKSVKAVRDHAFTNDIRLMKINCLSKSAPKFNLNYNPFTNVRTDKCQLIVPIGYKDEYTSTDWNMFTNISEDIFDNEDTDLDRYENVLFVSGCKGVAGLNTTMSLMMNNTIEAVGFQCDFYAPEKTFVPKDEDDFYMMDLSMERTNYSRTNLFETGLQADGAIRILCSSSKNYAFSGTTGEVATITLSLDKDITPGEYPLVLKNIVISNSDGRTYKVPYVKTTLVVESYKLGDANGDGEVNIGDYTTIANHIVGKPQDTFMEKAADTNQDNSIDVGDLTGLVNIILNGADNQTLSTNTDYVPLTSDISEYDNVIYALDTKADEKGVATISVNMKNSVEVPGYQFNIVLPDELEVPKDEDDYYQIELSTARTTPKKTNLFETGLQADGSIIVLCSSTKSIPFRGNDGEVCTIKVKFKDDIVKAGDYTITLKKIVISDTNGKTFKVDQTTATITVDDCSSADVVTEDSFENAEIYSVDGIRQAELQYGVNIVKYSSGKVKKVFVK